MSVREIAIAIAPEVVAKCKSEEPIQRVVDRIIMLAKMLEGAIADYELREITPPPSLGPKL